MIKYLTEKERHTSQLSMLKAIHNCCVANDIKYYLAFGTLIGAVRHKGFIPWDDDVDIMMSVEDYAKFKTVFNSDIFTVEDCFSNRKHGLCFPRLYDNRTCIEGNINSLGLFIDIYLIYNAPKTDYERAKLACTLINLSNKMLSTSKRLGQIARHTPMSFFALLAQSYSNFISRKQAKLLMKSANKESRLLYAFGGDGLTEYYWKDYFTGDFSCVQFEGNFFYAPNKYHEVLSTTYGDYMKLPPESERFPYHGSDYITWKN